MKFKNLKPHLWNRLSHFWPMTPRIRTQMRRWRAVLVAVSSVPILLATQSGYAADDAVRETARRVGMPVAHLVDRMRDCDSDQGAMNICAQYRFVEQDIALNGVFRRLRIQLKTDSAKKNLIAAQRAWVGFRDLDCSYEASGVEGGSMHAMLESDCRTRRTKERVVHLQAFLECISPGCPL